LFIHRKSRVMAEQRDNIKDPPALNPKGRPRTRRLTNITTEGQAQGGGGDVVRRRLAAASAGDSRNRRCGLCRAEGHNRTTCHLLASQR
jgi:hypothetical protein